MRGSPRGTRSSTDRRSRGWSSGGTDPLRAKLSPLPGAATQNPHFQGRASYEHRRAAPRRESGPLGGQRGGAIRQAWEYTMSKLVITSKHAPAAIGPYSQGVRAG